MVLIVAKAVAGKLVLVLAALILSVQLVDVIGLLGNHSFTSACGALATAIVALTQVMRNRRDGRLRRLEEEDRAKNRLIEQMRVTIRGQGTTIIAQGDTIERMGSTVDRQEAELAQVSEESLRRDNILARHSGERIPLRHAVPPVAIDLLLLDDEPRVLRSMSRVLERRGFHCDLAETIADAWRLIDARNEIGRRYDFAILDLLLPDGSIEDVLKLACEIHPGTDVIVVTGVVAEDILDRVKDCAAKVLIKPIDLDELEALLGRERES